MSDSLSDSPSDSLDSLITTIQLAATHVGVKPGAITWSSISSFAALTLVSAFVLFRVYYRPGKSVSTKVDLGSVSVKKMTTTRAMQRIRDAVIPDDGTVRVAEILIHPIKSCRGTSVQSCKYTLLGLENDREWCFVDIEKNAIITAREFPRIVLINPRIEEDPTDPHGGSIIVTFPPDAPEGCTEFRVPLHPSSEVLKNWEILDSLTLFSDRLDGYIGHSLPLSSPSLASAISSLYFSKPVHLVYKGPRARLAEKTPSHPSLDAPTVFQDGYPLLVMSRESMEELDEEVRSRVGGAGGHGDGATGTGGMGIGEEWRERKVDIRRFRPNIVLEGAGPYAEDAWEEMCIGSRDAPAVRLVSKCVRCLMPNVCPETGERDKAVPYKVLMKFRTGLDPASKLLPCVGCNGVFTGSGVVNVGDVVYVKKLGNSSESSQE